MGVGLLLMGDQGTFTIKYLSFEIAKQFGSGKLYHCLLNVFISRKFDEPLKLYCSARIKHLSGADVNTTMMFAVAYFIKNIYMQDRYNIGQINAAIAPTNDDLLSMDNSSIGHRIIFLYICQVLA